MIDQAVARVRVVEHLGTSPRADHSFLVGDLMKRIAEACGEEVELWEVVGICHDLDFEATRTAPEQHGMLTARWLEGQVPAAGLEAIRAHDHRTGIHSELRVAVALRLADACAVIADRVGHNLAAALRAPDPWSRLAAQVQDKPYLAAMVRLNCETLALEPDRLAKLVEAALEGLPVDGASPSGV